MHSEGQGDDSSQEEGIPCNPPKASLQSKGITVETQVSFSAPHADPTVHTKHTHTTRQEGKKKAEPRRQALPNSKCIKKSQQLKRLTHE